MFLGGERRDAGAEGVSQRAGDGLPGIVFFNYGAGARGHGAELGGGLAGELLDDAWELDERSDEKVLAGN